VTQVSATSFQVVDTSPGGVTQQFILNDAFGDPNYTQGPLVIGDDFYFTQAGRPSRMAPFWGHANRRRTPEVATCGW